MSGDIFVGTSRTGEEVARPQFVSPGQFVYRIVPRGQTAPGNGIERFTLGRNDVLRAVASSTNSTLVQALAPGVKVDSQPFSVDVILPFDAEPSQEWMGRVHVRPGAEVIIAVIPPAGKDPPLDVFTIPYRNQDKLELPPTGPGEPRFLRVPMEGGMTSHPPILSEAYMAPARLLVPREGGKISRLLIQWPFFPERDILVDFIPDDRLAGNAASLSEPEFALQVTDEARTVKLSPFTLDSFEFVGKVSTAGEPILPTFQLICPTRFPVELNGEFPGEGGAPVLRAEGRANTHTLSGMLGDMFGRGARLIGVSFGSLGSVSLRCPQFFQRYLDAAEESRRLELVRLAAGDRERLVRQRKVWREQMAGSIDSSLANLGRPIPRHISERFVLDLLGLPPGTPRDEVRILRYLVRRWRRFGSASGRLLVGAESGDRKDEPAG